MTPGTSSTPMAMIRRTRSARESGPAIVRT
jgi:hypothetical protein